MFDLELITLEDVQIALNMGIDLSEHMNSNYFDFDSADYIRAYNECRKGKMNTQNVKNFMEDEDHNLFKLQLELQSRTYEPGQSIMFVVTHPKPREIWAATFRDRIVHHLLVRQYQDHFYNRFIFDSYACIPNKGTLRAANRVEHFCRSASNNYQKPTYYLQADFKNFFVSIDKVILHQLLSKHITDPDWKWLMETILFHDPTKNFHMKSNKELLKRVPPHKSLLNSKPNCGLPIGNLSSQFFANVYLNEIDQFAKHKLKIKNYARYVDDIIMIDNDPYKLAEAYLKMDEFAQKNLNIQFHPDKTKLAPIESGINFVGYYILPYRKHIRKSTVKTFNDKSKSITDPFDMRAMVNSYYGMFRHCDDFKLRETLAFPLQMNGYGFDQNLTKLQKFTLI